ncbi:MAG: S9 family peptidase [Mobilicoccus sp.]|nr:S9 family peptidase [Mobilicoccus sp.]
MDELIPPPSVAERPHERTHHGDVVSDPYAWLRNSGDQEVVDLLHAENEYVRERTRHLDVLTDRIFAEIKGRTKETDLSVPVRDRGWWYYSRTQEGHQYGRFCRVPDTGERPTLGHGEGEVPGEQVLVDGEVEARGEFFSLGALEVSTSGERVAFAVDASGDERFDVVVRDIATGEVVDDMVRGVGYGLVWSTDDRFLFYTRVDDAWRPHEVWRHEVGTPAEQDVRLFVEEDETFWMGIDSSRDERWLVISVGSRSSSEAHIVPLEDPTAAPVCVRPRTPELEYDVEPAGDVLFVTHNADRVDFAVSWCPMSDVLAGDAPQWRPWWTPQSGERVLGVEAFASFIAVTLRSDGLPGVRLARRAADEPPRGELTGDDLLEVPRASVLGTVATGDNPAWDTTRLQIVQESALMPRRVCEFDPATGEVEVLKQREVLGGYDPDDYVEERVWVAAADGAEVPLSIVRRVGVESDGTAPGLLSGYGAYEISSDPYFSVRALSLLDRGVVLATAHVRGGGEMGRSWWLQGRLAQKGNSFTDLLACAEHLLDTGIVARGRLGLEGGSAGGLLVGATLNLSPSTFRVVHAAVPFVDALTTILDPSLPLTVGEWEEWGNPLADPEIYALMKGYSPYENLRPEPYPAILATSSLNDTRVQVGEPLKWVTRLRATAEGQEHPILMRTEMVAGHGGRSGRYDAWRQSAFETAFILDQLAATEVRA